VMGQFQNTASELYESNQCFEIDHIVEKSLFFYFILFIFFVEQKGLNEPSDLIKIS